MLPHTQGGAQDLCFQQAPRQTPPLTRRTHRLIPIHSFRQSYEAKSAHAHQTFFLEFKELKEVGKEQPRLGTEHPPNTTENQYPHVLPYDTSRDRLT
ncbi:receptor-type tyrosine-protein phosphatase V-like isoform X1 [Sapajus apella]|uniref:Receptor-type tyrosine-protein phosphatase V-like isoform X1 n=1 Tax=Sapajus apella TaxID=9515 RepID=A0A6J3IQY6_SAPAP|nr:receptor-type tyrosine-protein phosphatase V-like isoform X1 [Sapajus apella]